MTVFGAAFAEPETYTGARPGGDYLARALGSDLLIASEPMGDDLEAWNPVDPDAIVTVGSDFAIDPLFQPEDHEAESQTERPSDDRRAPRGFGESGGLRDRRTFGERRAEW